jgi:polyhydroxyalkanoate synthesis repressor PhaR
MAMRESGNKSDTVIIKKYANRRLYNTESSSYITLEHLAAMTREGKDFKVIDAKSGEDITHAVLTQIIVDEETRGQTMLPVNFLRQLIALYGDSMQALVPQYLEASMEAFRRNQTQFRDAMAGAFAGGPFAELAKRNMEMFESAASAFKRNSAAAKPAEPEKRESRDDELDELKAKLAELQEQIGKLVR